MSHPLDDYKCDNCGRKLSCSDWFCPNCQNIAPIYEDNLMVKKIKEQRDRITK